ncbi:MAG: ribonucleotide-diphosphate reductase subunit beta [Methylobacter sp.]
MQIRPVKHDWAMKVLQQMQDNTWDQREVDLSEDAKQYATGMLSDGNLIAYKKTLAFLSNLDGIQFNNLTMNIGKHITSPEVSMCIARQTWEEVLHVLSYAQMIESIGFDPQEIYWMFETDSILAEKNQYIMSSSEILGKTYSAENFVKAIAANIALEGIYFFNGFLVMYTLERQNLMRGSAKMIKLIQKDEETHLFLFLKMWQTMLNERPELFTEELMRDVLTIIDNAVNHEIVWGKYIISKGVLGLTDKIVEDFIKYLADERLSAMGLSKQYHVSNPVPWFHEASSVNNVEENSFESKISAYSTGALSWD